MKKNKKIKIGIIVTIILIILGGLGAIGVKKMTEPSTEEKQISFIKKHEDELTNYIKNNSDVKVSKVSYDWDNSRKSTVGNGTPSGAGKVIQIFGYINDQKQLDFRLDIQLDNGFPNLDTIKYGQKITEEGN